MNYLLAQGNDRLGFIVLAEKAGSDSHLLNFYHDQTGLRIVDAQAGRYVDQMTAPRIYVLVAEERLCAPLSTIPLHPWRRPLPEPTELARLVPHGPPQGNPPEGHDAGGAHPLPSEAPAWFSDPSSHIRLKAQPIKKVVLARDGSGLHAITEKSHLEITVDSVDGQSPAVFVPEIESHGLIGGFDRAVITATLHAMLATKDVVAVNVSTQTVGEPGFGRWFNDAVSRSGIEPGRLGLEIIESGKPFGGAQWKDADRPPPRYWGIDLSGRGVQRLGAGRLPLSGEPRPTLDGPEWLVAADNLRSIVANGHRLAIDDFGEGVSIATLQRLLDSNIPVSAIKISKTVTSAVLGHGGHPAEGATPSPNQPPHEALTETQTRSLKGLLRRVIDNASLRKIEVVIEGIESHAQQEQIVDLFAPTHLQGFSTTLGRPVFFGPNDALATGAQARQQTSSDAPSGSRAGASPENGASGSGSQFKARLSHPWRIQYGEAYSLAQGINSRLGGKTRADDQGLSIPFMLDTLWGGSAAEAPAPRAQPASAAEAVAASVARLGDAPISLFHSADQARAFLSSLPEGSRGLISLAQGSDSRVLNFRRIAAGDLEIVDALEGRYVAHMDASHFFVTVTERGSLETIDSQGHAWSAGYGDAYPLASDMNPPGVTGERVNEALTLDRRWANPYTNAETVSLQATTVRSSAEPIIDLVGDAPITVFEGARAARDARLYMASLPENARGFILPTTGNPYSSGLFNFRRIPENGLEIVDAHRAQVVTEMNAPKIIVMLVHERSWMPETTTASLSDDAWTQSPSE